MTRETLLSDIGGLHLEVPRDRNGSFEPRIVRKGQTRLDGFLAGRRGVEWLIRGLLCSK
jgi:transposase-like protein